MAIHHDPLGGVPKPRAVTHAEVDDALDDVLAAISDIVCALMDAGTITAPAVIAALRDGHNAAASRIAERVRAHGGVGSR